MELNQNEKISIVTGNGSWHTNAFEGKVKALTLSDGPHGLRKQDESITKNNESIPATCYPTAVSLASTWDKEILKEVADSLANEAIKEKVSIVLGPGTNIKRSPFGGRNFEYFSEDPYLAGKLAANYISSMESRGVGTCLKHFAGNSQETYRMTSNSRIDDRALREIYLRAFEIAVKEGRPGSIMASYNRLNGKYACENKELLTDILRKDWGFEGAVISDWGACNNLPASIEAGMDLEMPDSHGMHRSKLEEALKAGRLEEKYLDRAALNIVKLSKEYDIDNENRVFNDDLDPHDVALKAAKSAAVLLKNNGILPIKEKKTRLLCVGELAKEMRIQGGGSSHINIKEKPNAVEALKEKGFSVAYAKGYSAGLNKPEKALEEKAVELSRKADIILFFGGLTEKTEGEGYDRKDFNLPINQIGLLANLTDLGKPVVFIGFGGSPYAIPFFDSLSAFINMGLPGEAADEAVAALIAGEVNPSGKLAETWPLSYDDVPCKDFFAKDTQDVDYRESIFVGYRYYDTFNVPVRFEFGYGLSYTDFSYENIAYDNGKVSFTVKNTGNIAGAEISQVYVKNPKGSFIRENKSLRGFAKTYLNPGESREVSIDLDDRAFEIWSADAGKYIKVSGEYVIEAASSLSNVKLSLPVKISGEGCTADDRIRFKSYFPKDGERPKMTEEDFLRLYDKVQPDFTNIQKGEYSNTNSLKQLSERSPIAKILMGVSKIVVKNMFKGKASDDPELLMYTEGMENGTIDTVAVQSGGMITENMINAIIEDANGHHLKAVKYMLKRTKKGKKDE